MFAPNTNLIVRPILEYGNLVWGPYYKTDIQKLEKIQRKATRMIKSIRNLDYEERLKVLNLPSLHYRRYRGDMIAVYNMLHDKYDIDHSDFFTFSPITHTRGHTFKLFKYFSRTDARKYFFTRRVVEPWNNLPQEVACAASVDDFKKLIDHYSSNTMYKCI